MRLKWDLEGIYRDGGVFITVENISCRARLASAWHGTLRVLSTWVGCMDVLSLARQGS